MPRKVVIDCFPESARKYEDRYAIVAVDVIRATTTAVTAVAKERRCFPVPSIEAALPVAARLHHPLLVGELGGNMPYGFDLTNSPAHIDARWDIERPMILLSSSGTQLIHEARKGQAAYVACLRNYEALASHLARSYDRVAVIGAGTRNEFREEDQLCCSWVAELLMQDGFVPKNQRTLELVKAWKGRAPSSFLRSKSVEYLEKTNQHDDVEFILSHINDLDGVFKMFAGELLSVSVEATSRSNIIQ